jgi:hypothetical protein
MMDSTMESREITDLDELYCAVIDCFVDSRIEITRDDLLRLRSMFNQPERLASFIRIAIVESRKNKLGTGSGE